MELYPACRHCDRVMASRPKRGLCVTCYRHWRGKATPDDKPATAVTPHTIPAPAKKPVGVGAGTYEVGTDIKAGTYTTTVPGEADDITASCYWARLKDFDGDLGSILANGNLAGGSKGRVVVKAKDAGIEFRGDCRWVRK